MYIMLNEHIIYLRHKRTMINELVMLNECIMLNQCIMINERMMVNECIVKDEVRIKTSGMRIMINDMHILITKDI